MKEYFVIYNSNRNTCVDQLSEDTLLERINNRYYGPVGFINSIDINLRTNHRNDILIIEGNSIIPTTVLTIPNQKLK